MTEVQCQGCGYYRPRRPWATPECQHELYRRLTARQREAIESGVVTDLGCLYPLVCVIGVGEFRLGRRVEVLEFCGTGIVREPTAREMAELEYAMVHDTAQVLLKTRWGGYWKTKAADMEPKHVRTLHQPRGLGWRGADHNAQ